MNNTGAYPGGKGRTPPSGKTGRKKRRRERKRTKKGSLEEGRKRKRVEMLLKA